MKLYVKNNNIILIDKTPTKRFETMLSQTFDGTTWTLSSSGKITLKMSFQTME